MVNLARPPERYDDPLQGPIDEAAALLLRARYCIALTGAGISAESGIPTFRGKDGLWTKQGEPPLNQYQQFAADPLSWWEGARRRRAEPDALTEALQEADPNDAHFALAELERLGTLKHTITQNVDGLHQRAGSERITEIHGNRGLLRCLECTARRPFNDIPEALPPRCDHCGGLMKVDTVMFGEPIPRDALLACIVEAGRADSLLLVGTTALVSPAADFAWEVLSRGGTLIEVNLDPTVVSHACAVAIQAKAGEILPRITQAVKARRAPAS